jgi:hypothetical protein
VGLGGAVISLPRLTGTCIYVCVSACVLFQQCSVLLSSSAAIYLTPPPPAPVQWTGAGLIPQSCSIPQRRAWLPSAVIREAVLLELANMCILVHTLICVVVCWEKTEVILFTVNLKR